MASVRWRRALRLETGGGFGGASLIGRQAPNERAIRGYPRDRERALNVARLEARRLATALGSREEAVRVADRDRVRLGVLVGVPERRGVRRPLVRHAGDEDADSMRARRIRRIPRAVGRTCLVGDGDARLARVGDAPLDVGAGDARHGEGVCHRADGERRRLTRRPGAAGIVTRLLSRRESPPERRCRSRSRTWLRTSSPGSMHVTETEIGSGVGGAVHFGWKSAVAFAVRVILSRQRPHEHRPIRDARDREHVLSGEELRRRALPWDGRVEGVRRTGGNRDGGGRSAHVAERHAERAARIVDAVDGDLDRAGPGGGS